MTTTQKESKQVLTDKEIEDFAAKYIRGCGGHFTEEDAIPEISVEYFARDIERAVLEKMKPMLEKTYNCVLAEGWRFKDVEKFLND